MKAKKLLSLVLVLAVAMSVAVIAPKKISLAATVKSVTLIKGEKYVVTPLFSSTKIKSATSSKKSVVKIKKTSKKVTMTAKKPGKSVVKIYSKYGLMGKYTITVKKNTIKWKMVGLSYTQTSSMQYNSTVTFEVTNKTGVYIPWADLTYTIYDELGTELEKKTKTVYSLVSGRKAYFSVYLGYTNNKVGVGKLSKFKAGGRRSSLNYKYTNRSSKVSVSKTGQTAYNMSFKIKNKTKYQIDGVVDIVMYDASGNILQVSSYSLSLSSKGVTTATPSIPTGYDHYKKFVRATSKKYIG